MGKERQERKELLKAAEIVATCKPERLELMLEIFKQCGFNLSDELIQKAVRRNRDIEHAESLYIKLKRENRYQDKWSETDNPVIISLRNAYLSGFRIADIAKAACLTRTSLYDIMSGYRNISPSTVNSLILAFSKLNIPYPPEQ